MANTNEKRVRAEGIFHALAEGRLDLNDDKEAPRLAKKLQVPEALIWLAVDGVELECIDELAAWWPRKEGA